MVKRVIVLGSTGSIGTSTLDVIRDFPDQFKVVGLSARSRVDLLSTQAEEFKPEFVCISDSQLVESRGLGDQMHGAVLLKGRNGSCATG